MQQTESNADKVCHLAWQDTHTVCLDTLSQCYCLYTIIMCPFCLHCLFISNSTPRHLVCVHKYRNQWCGIYRPDQQVFTIIVTLTLNTASQSFHDTHLNMTIHCNIKFGCKRISSFEDIVEAIFQLYELCDLDLDDSKTKQIIFAWHSGSWWCITIPNLARKV